MAPPYRLVSELIFELSGPYYDLAVGEVKAVLESMGHSYEVIGLEEGILVMETYASVNELGARLGLTHRIMEHLLTTDEKNLIDGTTGIAIPEGSVAVTTRRIGGKSADTRGINRGLGAELSKSNDIDLDEPDHRVVVLVSENCVVGLLAHTLDKRPLADRLVKNRPYFSPVSLEPKLARALVNLSRPFEGMTVHDPFCGTGGILLEAADMGFGISGGDIDERMVDGCRKNLENYGYEGEVIMGDVLENIPEHVDRIVTDPPYGRSSGSCGEDVESIYDRLFTTVDERLEPGGYMAVIFPKRCHCSYDRKGLVLQEIYATRVHSSLKRYFCLYRKV